MNFRFKALTFTALLLGALSATSPASAQNCACVQANNCTRANVTCIATNHFKDNHTAVDRQAALIHFTQPNNHRAISTYLIFDGFGGVTPSALINRLVVGSAGITNRRNGFAGTFRAVHCERRTDGVRDCSPVDNRNLRFCFDQSSREFFHLGLQSSYCN